MGIFFGTVLQFVPDGKNIVVSQPGTPYQIQLYAADTGKLVNSMKLKSAVGAIKFSPDGKLLAVICQDGALLILHPDLSGQLFSKQVQKFAFGESPRALAFVGDGHLAVRSSAATVELLDTLEWKSVRSFAVRQNRVNCVAGSPDGKLLAIGSGQTATFPGLVYVWEAATGLLVKELK